MQKMKYLMFRVASCFNRVIELNRKMLIVSKFLTKMLFFFNLAIKLNSLSTEPFKLNVILSRENKISDVASRFNCD